MNTTTATTTKTSVYQTMSISGAVPVALPARDYMAVNVGDAGCVVLLHDGKGPKRGHKLCGGCCDVRRAVIIVNMVVGGLTLLVFIFVLPLAILFVPFPLAPCALGIMGAIRYNVRMVGAAALNICVIIGVGLSAFNQHFNMFGVALFAFFLYPHILFIKEVRDGIMSKENYENERHSCCCV
jgi:hypothetical protein